MTFILYFTGNCPDIISAGNFLQCKQVPTLVVSILVRQPFENTNVKIAFLEQELQVFCPPPIGAMINSFSEQGIFPAKE
jgi:hypothetical protein